MKCLPLEELRRSKMENDADDHPTRTTRWAPQRRPEPSEPLLGKWDHEAPYQRDDRILLQAEIEEHLRYPKFGRKKPEGPNTRDDAGQRLLKSQHDELVLVSTAKWIKRPEKGVNSKRATYLMDELDTACVLGGFRASNVAQIAGDDAQPQPPLHPVLPMIGALTLPVVASEAGDPPFNARTPAIPAPPSARAFHRSAFL
jgi:hypothetical protein